MLSARSVDSICVHIQSEIERRDRVPEWCEHKSPAFISFESLCSLDELSTSAIDEFEILLVDSIQEYAISDDLNFQSPLAQTSVLQNFPGWQLSVVVLVYSKALVPLNVETIGQLMESPNISISYQILNCVRKRVPFVY